MWNGAGEEWLDQLDAVVELRTTFSCREAAESCAARLVAAGLAACVQIDGPVTSVYRWEGAVETAEEFRCTVKTSRERAAACAADILARHDYRVPELMVSLATASAPYAAWVLECARTERPPGA